MIDSIPQAEGDALLNMEKYSSSSGSFDFPALGGVLELNFKSKNGREEFVLNYTGYRINLSKRNHNLRGRKNIGLARLDLDGPPHRNPDGEEISKRHLHLYKEGYELKWAFDVPSEYFKNLDDAYETLMDFMKYCNVIVMPKIKKDLFS